MLIIYHNCKLYCVVRLATKRAKEDLQECYAKLMSLVVVEKLAYRIYYVK